MKHHPLILIFYLLVTRDMTSPSIYSSISVSYTGYDLVSLLVLNFINPSTPLRMYHSSPSERHLFGSWNPFLPCRPYWSEDCPESTKDVILTTGT